MISGTLVRVCRRLLTASSPALLLARVEMSIGFSKATESGRGEPNVAGDPLPTIGGVAGSSWAGARVSETISGKGESRLRRSRSLPGHGSAAVPARPHVWLGSSHLLCPAAVRRVGVGYWEPVSEGHARTWTGARMPMGSSLSRHLQPGQTAPGCIRRAQ